MMKRLVTLAAGLMLALPAGAETVLPRVSPLAEVDDSGAVTGASVPMAFGQPLQVIQRAGTVVTVQGADGSVHHFAAADLIAPPAAQAGVAVMAAPGRDAGDRPDLPLWDSAARGRLYLQGSVADSLRPALTETPGGTFPAAGLPVFALESAPTSVGHPVLMAGAWVPVMPEAMDPGGSAAPREVVLHVLVDGSDYARDFTLETLQHLSRAVQEDGTLAAFTRQVIFEDGTIRDDGAVPAAGLRAEWPEAAAGATGGLNTALSQAVDRVAEGITPGDGAAHLVLALVGPGLASDEAAMAAVRSAGDRLAALRAKGADLRGVVLMQGTPEPNPANDAVLAQVAGGATTGFVDFGGDALAALRTALSAAPQGDAASLAARRDALCGLAADRALPCVIAAPGVLPPLPAADWVAMPLWFVLDGAALDLVPAAMDPKDARAAQDAIRACLSAGQVWDAALSTCGTGAISLSADAESVQADLVAVQGQLATVAEERDAAQEDLARQSAEWEDQRSTLQATLDQSAADLAAAQAELEARAETISGQEAALSDRDATISDLTDRADALARSVSDLQAQLEGATADAARMQDDLAARDDQIAALADQVTGLTQARETAEADLAATRDELAKAMADRDRLAEDLTAAKGAQMAAEEAFAQERADWQARTDAAAQALAEMTASRDAAAAQVADLTAARDALQASKDDLTAQLATETAARTEVETTLATVRAEAETAAAAADRRAAEADAAAQKAAAQLLAAQTDYAALSAERDALAAQIVTETARADDLAAMKASLSTSEGKIREDYATASRQLTEAEAKVADLTTRFDQMQARAAAAETERDAAVAALTEAKAQVTASQDRLAALGAERDALALQVTQTAEAAKAQTAELTDRLAKAEAEVARLTADMAATPVAEDLTQPDGETVAMAVSPALKPKARPAAVSPKPEKAAAKAPSKTAAKAAKAPVKVAEPLPAPQPSRRVAPATAAPQLKGCQFQWVGKEGRLVCP